MTEWRTVAARPHYRVSDSGEVMGPRGGVLKPSHTGYGHARVTLHSPTGTFYVHRLVLEAFVGPCPEGMEACHGLGGRADNRVANLSWGTRKKNLGPDRERDGTMPNHPGEENPSAKLTDAKVAEIRRRLGRGETCKSIASDFGVTRACVGNIKTGKSWRHLAVRADALIPNAPKLIVAK